MEKLYTVCDAFDGRTLVILGRVSTRKKAKEHARKFACGTTDDVVLIESVGTERRIIAEYRGQAREKGMFVRN